MKHNHIVVIKKDQPPPPPPNWRNPAFGHRIGLALALLAGIHLPATTARAGYASQGQGMQAIITGTVPNGALFMETRATWINTATPPKPYVVNAGFTLPVCEAVPVSRLVMTVWGGTANYICNLGVQINGTNVPGVSPLTFGTTTDANAVFSATTPSVYGAGAGVWLVGLPVPPELWFKDGTSNHVQLTVTTPDSFDGRINHVTLVAVYQSAALSNEFEYVVAEGSGDIYRAPTGLQVDARTVSLGTLSQTNATSARLRALYTYGDVTQNDRLFFNGVQFGGDNVADYDSSITGQGFGPDVVDFDVLANLASSNVVTFTVSAADGVPDTRETSLRPQLAILEVTRPPTPALAIALNVVITWPVTADAYQLEFRPNAGFGDWTAVTNTPVVINGQNTVMLPPTSPQQFYQLRKTN